MAINVGALGNTIINEAIKRGGGIWIKIQNAAPLYIRGFAQTLASIAAGVAKGEISKKDAAMYVRNARLLLIMGIANTCQVVLIEVQAFIDSVVNAARASINGALPVAIL